MSFVIKQHHTENHYIFIALENNLYIVRVCPLYDWGCGYPIREMLYHYSDKKKAYATYNRYIKKYTD